MRKLDEKKRSSEKVKVKLSKNESVHFALDLLNGLVEVHAVAFKTSELHTDSLFIHAEHFSLYAAVLSWKFILLVLVRQRFAKLESALPLLLVPLVIEGLQILEGRLQLAKDRLSIVLSEDGSRFSEESLLIELVQGTVLGVRFRLFSLAHVDLFTSASLDSLHLFFLLFLSLLLLLDDLVALDELFLDLLIRGNFTSHPRVTDYVNEAETHVGTVLQHVCDKVLELLGEKVGRLVTGVVLPEQVSTVGHQQLVVRVVGVGLFKWRVARVQNEQNDAESEQVCLVALVGFLADQLRGHVGDCAQLSEQVTAAIAALERSSEAKVSDLQVVVRIEHHILRFEVTVGKTLGVSVVHRLQHLLEECAAN